MEATPDPIEPSLHTKEMIQKLIFILYSDELRHLQEDMQFYEKWKDELQYKKYLDTLKNRFSHCRQVLDQVCPQ